MVSDETGLCSWIYAVGHACLIVCQVMSALLRGRDAGRAFLESGGTRGGWLGA
jgi:hypothetical protein